jgi:uncharacterized membrane protein SpoIIM required for sporulation
MKQQPFETRHQPLWQAFSLRLSALERGKARSAHSEGFSQDYRRVCQHLALARSRGYSSHLIDHLEQLVLRGHRQLYRHRSQVGAQIAAFVLADFPRQVRRQWRLILLASLLLGLTLLGSALWIYCWPEQVYSLLDPAQVSAMEHQYDPQSSRLGMAADRPSSQDWQMFGYYVMNNVGIAFQTFAGGLLGGLGSVFFLIFNGLTIGAVAGHLTHIGSGQTFWSFVIGHSAFELPAIALAGAAGLGMGWALIAPGSLTRGEALRIAARASMPLVYGALLMLLMAAFVEAYWSARTTLAPALKFAVGAALWLLLAVYLSSAGRGAHAAE